MESNKSSKEAGSTTFNTFLDHLNKKKGNHKEPSHQRSASNIEMLSNKTFGNSLSKSGNQKTTIESIKDLKKLSFTQIKQLNVKNMSGKYFSRIFDHTVKTKRGEIEPIQKPKDLSIKFIEFQVNYKADFGYSLHISGSCQKLGNWLPSLSYTLKI